jgi:hypothetical protein
MRAWSERCSRRHSAYGSHVCKLPKRHVQRHQKRRAMQRMDDVRARLTHYGLRFDDGRSRVRGLRSGDILELSQPNDLLARGRVPRGHRRDRACYGALACGVHALRVRYLLRRRIVRQGGVPKRHVGPRRPLVDGMHAAYELRSRRAGAHIRHRADGSHLRRVHHEHL